jgi:hypothetical protein
MAMQEEHIMDIALNGLSSIANELAKASSSNKDES